MRRCRRRCGTWPAMATADDRIRYSSPLGFAPLRQHLAGKLGERGVGVAPDGIMLTDSASAAIDLVCRFLIEPGDAVLVDDPCYFNFLAMLLSHRAKVIGVPYGADGPDVEAFGQALAAHRPRLYLTTGGLHNPTGGTISAAKAHRLLNLAEQHDIVIIEDDTFADLEHELSPRLAGFDGLDRVIQVGGYAKTVSSAIRCGYVAARPDWLDALVDLKLSTCLGNGHFASVLLHRVLTDGNYRRHVDGLRTKLACAMGLTLERIKTLGLEPALEPKAGMFIWARLPDDLDAAAVARLALAENVLFAPGNVFSASHSARSNLRFKRGALRGTAHLRRAGGRHAGRRRGPGPHSVADRPAGRPIRLPRSRLSGRHCRAMACWPVHRHGIGVPKAFEETTL